MSTTAGGGGAAVKILSAAYLQDARAEAARASQRAVACGAEVAAAEGARGWGRELRAAGSAGGRA